MSLKVRIVFWLVILYSISLSMLVAISVVNERQAKDGLVVNLAGRQRMLTQRVGEFYLLREKMQETGGDITQIDAVLTQSIELFETTLAALHKGGSAPVTLDMDGKWQYVPDASAEVSHQLELVAGKWAVFRDVLKADQSRSKEITSFAVASTEVLQAMDTAVNMFQKEQEKRVEFTFRIQILLTVVGFLLLLFALWRFSCWLLTPLYKLGTFGKKIQQGRLPDIPQADYRYELLDIANAFYHLRADSQLRRNRSAMKSALQNASQDEESQESEHD